MKRSFKSKGAKHKKLPVPRKAVWWLHLDKHPVYLVLGSVIRSMRTIRGWSLRDLHRGTKLAFSYLSNLEKGDIALGEKQQKRIDLCFANLLPGICTPEPSAASLRSPSSTQPCQTITPTPKALPMY